jgi:hypothetical protein
VLGSNIGPNTGFSNCGLLIVFLIHSIQMRDSISIKPQPFLSTTYSSSSFTDHTTIGDTYMCDIDSDVE